MRQTDVFTATLRKHPYTLGLGLVSVLTCLLYVFNLSSNFLEGFDDDWGIYENPLVQTLSWENLKRIWLNDTIDTYYIPLTFTSFSIDVAIWGNNAYALKMINLLLFIGSGWLLFYLFALLKVNKQVALIAVVFYLLHPIQVENVAWAACRRQILSMVFLLAASIYYIKFHHHAARGRLYYGRALLCFFLAVMAKPPAMVFFPFVVVTLIYLRYKQQNAIQLLISDMVRLLPFFLVVVFSYIMNAIAAERNFIHGSFAYDGFQHLLIVTSSFGAYLVKLFSGPYVILYPLPAADEFQYAQFICYSFLAICLALLGLYLLFTKRPILGAGIVWYFLALIPSSLLLLLMSDFPLNTADRYFLMAAPGIFLLVAHILYRVLGRYSMYVAVLISIPMGYHTFHQVRVWDNSLTVMEHCNKYSPTEEMYYRSAIIYYQQGEAQKAFDALDNAKNLDKGFVFNMPFYTDILLAYMYQEKGDKDYAAELLTKALYKDLALPPTDEMKASVAMLVEQLFPIPERYEDNIRAYLRVRQELLDSDTSIQLRPKRL